MNSKLFLGLLLNIGQLFAAQNARPDGGLSMASPYVDAPPTFYSAFRKDGPILVATIEAVLSPNGGITGKLRVGVQRTIRGPEMPSTFDLPFTFTTPNPKRPPTLWDRVPPSEHAQICVLLSSDTNHPSAECILEPVGKDRELMPVLSQMVALERSIVTNGGTNLLEEVANANPLIRSLATDLLLFQVTRERPGVRAEVLDKLVVLACNQTNRSEARVQAVSNIGHKVYQGFSTDDRIDGEAVASLFGLVTNSTIEVRAQAVQVLHSLFFGGGAQKPSLAAIALNRADTTNQLYLDAMARVYFSNQAEDLLKLLSTQ
jgi:hypothetical protein